MSAGVVRATRSPAIIAFPRLLSTTVVCALHSIDAGRFVFPLAC